MTIAPQRPPGLALDRSGPDDYLNPPNNGPAPPPQESQSSVGYYYEDDEDGDDGEGNVYPDNRPSRSPTEAQPTQSNNNFTPVLPPSQYELNLEQEIADLEAQLADNRERYQRLAVEGLVEIPVQGPGLGGTTFKIVRLSHPPEEDAKREDELRKQIERNNAALFGSSPGPGNGGAKRVGTGAAATPEGEAGAGAGAGDAGNELIQPPPTGVLSRFTERWSWAGWIDRKPLLTVLLAAFFIVVGIVLALMGFSTHDTQDIVTVPATTTGQNQGQSGANGAVTATALATVTPLPAPTITPAPATTLPATPKPPVTSASASASTAATTTNQSRTVTTTAQSQSQLDLSWQPHGGYLPPRSLQIPALSYNVDRLVKAQSSLDTQAASGGSGKAWFTLSSPVTGTLYHFGGYPGEAGTNLVLVGSYDTLGKTLEVLQQNDKVQVLNREGGIYTYLLLSYPRLQAKLQSEAARGTVTATPPASTLNLTPLPTPGQAAVVTPDVRLTAAVLAQRYNEDQLVQIAHKDDLDILEVPGLSRASSTITLISLPPPGAPADERIVVRGDLAYFKPAQYTLPGTPVP